MTAAVRTATGTYLVDLAEEELIGEAEPFEPARIDVTLPRVVATAASGSTVVAVVDRRPPLALSNDAGRVVPGSVIRRACFSVRLKSSLRVSCR